MKIAVAGANGQVGSEVCLLLRGVPDIEVVPIVRNPSGSAFLRLQGLDCRHGKMADPCDARRLIGDCDVVADFALSTTGRPRVDRVTNRAITRNVVEAAKPGARLSFFSTIMVYAPNTAFGLIPDAYGLEKILNERLFSGLCKRLGHEACVFRLGHVLGELQNITRTICTEIRNGPVALPDGGDRPSNTVFTAMVAQALIDIARGKVVAGTFDLISSPQWTWREVYAYYAEESGIALDVVPISTRRAQSSGHAVPGRLLRSLMGYMSSSQFMRERLSFLLGLLPERVSRTVHIRYLQARALREISALSRAKSPIVATDWRGISVRPLPSVGDARDCLRAFPLRLADERQEPPVVCAP